MRRRRPHGDGCQPHDHQRDDGGEAGRDTGAGFVEYAGLMIIIAGIFVMIDQLGLDGLISGAIRNAVTQVTGGGGFAGLVTQFTGGSL